MKKSTKLISLVLSVVLAFSFIPVIASAGVVPSSVTNVESLIKNDNLAGIVDWLLKNLAGSKENITGTVLRLVFTFMDDDSLNAVIGDRDPVKLSDEENAKILLDWLDKNLPEWTKDITSQSWYGTVQTIIKLISVNLDLASVNGVLNTVYSIGTNGLVHGFGDLKGLTADSLEIKEGSGIFAKKRAIQRKDGDLQIVYALLNWLEEVSPLLEDFVKGGISGSGLSVGSVLNGILEGSLDDINTIIKNVPTFAKGYLYLLIDGYAETPDIKKNPAGGWGTSDYKDYTADELLAAALIRVCTVKYDDGFKFDNAFISKDACDEVAGMTVYEVLAEYGPQLYKNLAVDALNGIVKETINNINRDYDNVLAGLLKSDYNFTDDTFAKEFEDIKNTGIFGQFNNILVKVAEVMVNADVFKALDLKTGTNEAELNNNLTKILRKAAPVFTQPKVVEGLGMKIEFKGDIETLTLEDMAAQVLKLFFPKWFDTCTVEDLNACTTLEQLGTLAVYYVYHDNLEISTVAKPDFAKIADQQAAYDTILNWSGKIAADAIAGNKNTRYTAPASGDYMTYFNSIVDWALNFVKGLPAIAVKKDLYNSDKDCYYKLDVVINALVDFNFLNNVSGKTFVLDVETLIFDALLGNVLDFNFAGLLGLFEKNDKADNFLNNNTVAAVLGIVDKAITALFDGSYDPEGKAAPDVMLGDVDKDGEITVMDARTALRRAIDLETFAETTPEYIACDVDGDKGVTVTDARAILRVAIQLDPASSLKSPA